MSIHLVCIAPDGEFVTEGRNFTSVDEAWKRYNEMGSRWIFYPIPVVTNGDKILAVPHGCMDEWIGQSLSTFLKAIKLFPTEVSLYLEGKTPLSLSPNDIVENLFK